MMIVMQYILCVVGVPITHALIRSPQLIRPQLVRHGIASRSYICWWLRVWSARSGQQRV